MPWPLLLVSAAYRVDHQYPVQVWFRGRKVGDFKADLLVEGLVLLELKAARSIEAVHEAQVMNYLRATDIEVGLLLNFGLEPQFRRLAYDNDRKRRPGPSPGPSAAADEPLS